MTGNDSRQHARGNPATTKSILLGLVFGFIFWATAGLTLGFWSIPKRIDIEWQLAITIALLPIQALCTGELSRQGKFLFLSATMFGANLAGMLISSILLQVSPTGGILLTVSTTTSVIFVGASLLRLRRNLLPLAPPSLEDFALNHFSAKVFYLRFFWYLNSNVSRWSLIRLGSPELLGNLNRAEVAGALPIQQIQTALAKPLYPSIARLRGTLDRTVKDIHTRGANAIAVLLWPALAIFASVAPALVLALLGGKWSIAAQIVPVLLIAGAVQLPAVVIGTILETQNRFFFTYLIEGALLVMQVSFLCFYHATFTVLYVSVILAITMGVRLLLSIVVAARFNLIDGSRTLTRHIGAALVSLSVYYSINNLPEICSPKNMVAQSGVRFSLALIAAVCFILFIFKTKAGKLARRDLEALISA